MEWRRREERERQEKGKEENRRERKRELITSALTGEAIGMGRDRKREETEKRR